MGRDGVTKLNIRADPFLKGIIVNQRLLLIFFTCIVVSFTLDDVINKHDKYFKIIYATFILICLQIKIVG